MNLDGVLNTFEVPAILIDRSYRIQAVNEAYQKAYPQKLNLGCSRCFEISHDYERPCDEEGESCPIPTCLETGQAQRILHIHNTSKGKEYVDVEMRPIFDEQGEINGFLETVTRIDIASATPSTDGLVGRSPAFRHALRLIHRVAEGKTTVLLTGESGTGKEVVARAIHDASDRYGRAFVPVECSGLTETLFESELFGHEKGAFTGATGEKTGLVEAAHQGTLFLDEVGDIPPNLQVKLLRLLETRQFRRVGGIVPLHSDFRLICATNQNLTAMLKARTFRLDLYYRISVFPIVLPPLRERLEDLPLLIRSILDRKAGHNAIRIDPEVMRRMERWPFPGNIRELQNILERALILRDGNTLGLEHFPDLDALPLDGSAPAVHGTDFPWQGEEIISLDHLECAYLNFLVQERNVDKPALARSLGISQRTLYRKLERCRAHTF